MIGTGAIVGSYEILERLGTGGMGEVYRARHLHLDRQAAIKMLLMELSQDREAVDRFFAEARATSLIRHPGIVEVLDCNVHESGRVYLVMELLEGETLADRLRRDPGLGQDLPLVLGIADQLADALGAAHARGIIHRDLKPENVFLVDTPAAQKGGAPRVKVLDFGIAKLLNSRGGWSQEANVHTQADRVLGTPAYMSPEQCRDARCVDHRTDIYALGCVLFEMIAGHVPFEASTFGQLVAAQLWEPPPPLPPPAAGLVARMMAKDPSARLQSMSAVRSEIARVMRRARLEGRGGRSLLDLRRRWEALWDGRIAPRLPPVARPVGQWLGGLLGSRRWLVGFAIGWVATVSIVAGASLRDRGGPPPRALARPSSAVAAAAPASPVAIPRAQVAGAPSGTSSLADGGAGAGLSLAVPPAGPDPRDPEPAPSSVSASAALRPSPWPDPPDADRDATEAGDNAAPRAERSTPRTRSAKTGNLRPAAARGARTIPSSEAVDLTDDQRKL